MKVKRSEVLDMDYVTVDGMYIMENGVSLRVEDTVKKTAKEILALYAIASEGKLYDYQYAKNTGYVRSKRDLSKESRERMLQVASDEAVVKEISEKDPITMIGVIRILMLVVGVGAMAMSIFYNQEALRDYLPTFFAVVLASTMIIFSTMAFEAAVLFHNRHMNLFSVLFASLWLIVTIYSMFSIMSVNYTNYHAKEEVELSDNKEINSGRLQLSSIKAKKDIQNEQIDTQKKKIEEYKAKEKQNAWTLTQYENDLKKMQAGLVSLIDEELRIQKETPESVILTSTRRESFFDYLGSLISVSPGLLQFLLSTLPALFIDLIAPFSVAIAIFLGKEGEKNGNKA